MKSQTIWCYLIPKVIILIILPYDRLNLRKVIKTHRHTKPQIQNTETPDCIKYIYFISQILVTIDSLVCHIQYLVLFGALVKRNEEKVLH